MTGKILQTIYARFIRKESVPLVDLVVVAADMTMSKLLAASLNYLDLFYEGEHQVQIDSMRTESYIGQPEVKSAAAACLNLLYQVLTWFGKPGTFHTNIMFQLFEFSVVSRRTSSRLRVVHAIDVYSQLLRPQQLVKDALMVEF